MPRYEPSSRDYKSFTAAELSERYVEEDVFYACALQVSDYLAEREIESRSDLRSGMLRQLVIMIDGFHRRLPPIDTHVLVVSDRHIDDAAYRVSADEIARPVQGSFMGTFKACELGQYRFTDDTPRYLGLVVKSCVHVGNNRLMYTTPVIGSQIHTTNPN